jgi:hypothetical protein
VIELPGTGAVFCEAAADVEGCDRESTALRAYVKHRRRMPDRSSVSKPYRRCRRLSSAWSSSPRQTRPTNDVAPHRDRLASCTAGFQSTECQLGVNKRHDGHLVGTAEVPHIRDGIAAAPNALPCARSRTRRPLTISCKSARSGSEGLRNSKEPENVVRATGIDALAAVQVPARVDPEFLSAGPQRPKRPPAVKFGALPSCALQLSAWRPGPGFATRLRSPPKPRR